MYARASRAMVCWLSGGNSVDPPKPVPVPGLTVIAAPAYTRVPAYVGCRRQPMERGGSVARRSRLVSGKAAVGHPVRTGRFDTKSFHFVFLVGGEVAFEPEPFGLVVVVALPRENVRAGAVEEPPVVGDHHSAAGEVLQRILQRTQRF